MKIDIAESIREVLCDRHPVSIYGLGTLCLKQIPASYGEKRTSLLPPTMTLEFTESSSTNSKLTQWLVDKYDIKTDQANLALKKFSEKVLNTLLNYRSVNIPGVALFNRNEANEIVFTGDSTLTEHFYKNMPVVDLILPEISIEEKEQVADQKIAVDLASSIVEPISEKKDEPIEELTSKDSTQLESNEPDGMSAEEMIVFDLESELKQIAESKTQSKTIPDHKEKETSFNFRKLIGSLFIVLMLVLAAILLIDACKNIFKPSSDSIDTEAAQLSVLGDNIVGEDSLSRAMLSGEEMTTNFETDSCIIVTGVFSSMTNVDKMSQLIENRGYEVYQERNGNYTRVGLKFDCTDVDLESFIREIRNEISPQAWYLNPELFVAYSN